LRRESIRAECERSLQRLGLDRIDLYQFHWPDPDTPVEESWSTMVELVNEGKVRWIGACNFSVELLERCQAVRHVDSCQPPLNLLNRGARDDVIPWCRDNGTGVIAYSPMASGLLTGAFSAERIEQLAEDDWRRRDAAFREPQLSRALELVDRIRPIADRLACSLPALAVAWVRAVPGVTGAIVGARRPSQVDDWIEAGDLELDDETLREIEELLH
jgi:aryl-alcohol dehydrogenase-like predicted oxidoreductase